MKHRLPILLIGLATCTSGDTKQNQPVYNEASLKTFVLAGRTADESTVARQLDSVLRSASKDSIVFRQTITFLEAPFGNPNSPYRSQPLYAKLLTAKVQYPWYSSDEKKVAADKIKLLQQNNVGHPANDFTYVTAAGYHKKMYDIRAKLVLLYFNNPECDACRQMKMALMNSSIINDKLISGDLKILSIYTDKEEKIWLDHLKEYPDNWLQGRDEDEYLYQHKVYDLRAIPSVYLLDSDKKVMLKDCMDVAAIEAQINR